MQRLLDVSELAAPEPLERVLESIGSLARGECLHVYHRQEPLLLYPILDERGYRWLSATDHSGMVHVLIWREDDERACDAAQDAIRQCTRT